MSSDVCKHCSSAACLEVCPTGALFRTEFSTVVVQPDICNGCGYCVPACPFGVIDRREDDGRAFKCTLCYDRLRDGLQPACATACPTDSIQFGELDELRERATGAGGHPARGRGRRGPAVPGGRGRRRRRRRRVLPAAGRAGGVRPARPTRCPPPATCPPCGGRPRSPPGRWRPRWRRVPGRPPVSRPGDGAGRGRRPGPRVGGARGRVPLLLRPADHQGAGLDLGGPLVLLRRRPGRGLGLARAGGAADRQRPAGPERLDGLGPPG